jgi:hypothetical protein
MRIFPLRPATRAIGAFRHTIAVPAAPQVEAATTAPITWHQKADDTFWTGFDSTNAWDGTKWYDPGLGTGLEHTDDTGLLVVGAWAVGYRPAALRITLSSSPTLTLSVGVYNSVGDLLNADPLAAVTVTGTPAAFVVPLDFTAVGGHNMDIDHIIIEQLPNTQSDDWFNTINNVEFES